MRIAYLSDYSPENINIWSGTPYHIFHALKNNHDVEWIGGGLISGAKWHHIFVDNYHSFHVENYTKEIGRLLSERINRGNFDIVITCTYHFCIELKISIPIIYFSDITFNEFEPWLKNNDPKYPDICRKTERQCLEKVSAIIYPTEWAKKCAIKNYQIDCNKIHVIEFGANIPSPQNVLNCIKDNESCELVFIGRDPKRKGLNKALETFSILKQLGFACNLTVVGCPLPQKIQCQNVRVYPFLDKEKAEDMLIFDQIMRKTHFLILPTEFDAFGIVFCEASAYGIPSITTDVAGVSQPVRNGVNGFVLPSAAKAEDYAHIIQKTFCNKKLYNQLCYQARHEFDTRLNWQRWCNRITSLSEKLIQDYKDAPRDEFFLPTYVINLKEREDRHKHIEKQFSGKTEFEVTFIDAIKHPIGAVGLWESLKKIIKIAMKKEEDVILVCEDDHFFTKHYSKEYLFSNIIGAANQGAELLSGGISNYRVAVPVSAHRYWIDRFFATQFLILYKPIFNKILNYDFQNTDAEDLILPLLSEKCMVMFPFISEQYDFGYSDVTEVHNENPGIVTRMFCQTKQRLSVIQDVRNRFCSS